MNEEKKSNLPMILGIGCLVTFLLGGAALGGCIYLGITMVDKAFEEASTQLLTQVDDEAERKALEAKFEKVKAADLPTSQKALFMAVLGNLTNDDQKISGDEITKLHEVMDLCIEKGADVDLSSHATGGG